MGTNDQDISGLTLQDLAAETGVEPRTIRSYVEKGVIPGPESLGRGARYPRETLDRLKVLQLLRDANRSLTLDQIRVLLHGIGPSQLRAIADGTVRIGAVIDTDAAGSGPLPRTAAMDYLQSLRQPTSDSRSGDLWTPLMLCATAAPLGLDDDRLPVFEAAAREIGRAHV